MRHQQFFEKVTEFFKGHSGQPPEVGAPDAEQETTHSSQSVCEKQRGFLWGSETQTVNAQTALDTAGQHTTLNQPSPHAAPHTQHVHTVCPSHNHTDTHAFTSTAHQANKHAHIKNTHKHTLTTIAAPPRPQCPTLHAETEPASDSQPPQVVGFSESGEVTVERCGAVPCLFVCCAHCT